MCEVCAIFGAGEHWSDFARLRDERFPFDDIMHYRSERARRLAMLNLLFARKGLTCEDWDGEAIAVYDKVGRFRLAATLNDIWSAAEALGQTVFDPLSKDFFETQPTHFVAEAV
jgi:hypothetical protein